MFRDYHERFLTLEHAGPGEELGEEETHTTPDTIVTGREVSAAALGALAALGAGLAFVVRGRTRRA